MEQLNGQFANANEYFNQVVSFLDNYQWINENANTHILVHQVAERVPIEWTNFLNFNHLQEIKEAIAGHCPVTEIFFFFLIMKTTKLDR